MSRQAVFHHRDSGTQAPSSCGSVPLVLEALSIQWVGGERREPQVGGFRVGLHHFPLKFHWPENCHMTTCHCKEVWEM